ncbi:MAG: helix-turn-helix domain-containing protein [Acutalibacteraceae bacterium]
MTVLDRIVQLRLERGWSEYRLSEESGIAQSTISSWFRKNITPTISSIESICKAYNITLSQFFDFNDEAVTLTDSQKELLSNWSRLTEKQQKIFLELLKAL